MLDINKINNPKLKRLEENGLVIEEIYLHNNEISVRSTDGKENDSIYKAIKIEKNFYKDKKLLFREEDFDKKTTYTIPSLKGDKTVKCSECGYDGPIKDFFDGCPYCKANFSMDYSTKRKSYGKELKEIISTKWIQVLTIILSLVCSIYNICQNPSIGYIIAGILSVPIFYMFFTIILLFISFPFMLVKLVEHKDIANNRISIRGKQISNINLIKSINSELFNYIFDNENINNKDIIDYDILDYVTYKVINNIIIVELKIRKYIYDNNKIKKVITNETFEFIENINYTEEKSIVKKCPNCGANVPSSKKKCEYCNTIVPSNNLWIMK